MQIIKKLCAILLVSCGFMLATSANAYVVDNDHVTRCSGNVCAHYVYHRYCQWGHCWERWIRTDYVR